MSRDEKRGVLVHGANRDVLDWLADKIDEKVQAVDVGSYVKTVREAAENGQVLDVKEPQDKHTSRCQGCRQYSNSVKVCPNREPDSRYLCWECRKAIVLTMMRLGKDAATYNKLPKSVRPENK